MTKAAELAKMGEVLTNSQIGGRRNVIINGSQQVAQRATSVADVGGSQGYFCTDRFKSTFVGTAARYTISQDSDAPAGFSKCLKYDVTTADTSVAADEFHAITYQVEGQDISHFEWGTSDAKQCTFSFYAKATTAQTVVVNFVRVTSGTSRSLSKAFSITTSYQRFTFTLPADTGGSAQAETNGLGLSIHIGLGAGSNYTGGTINETWEDITNNKRMAGVGSLASSTDNNFFITGVQLEVGEQATPFEHRSYGEELALCQRYYEKKVAGASYHMFGIGRAVAANRVDYKIDFVVSKRAEGATASFSNLYSYSSAANAEVSTLSTSYFGKEGGLLSCVLNTSSMSVNVYAALLSNNDPAAFLAFDSEL